MRKKNKQYHKKRKGNILFIISGAMIMSLFVLFFYFFQKQNLISNFYSFQKNYNGQKKIRILIVPGHEPDYGGAVFKNTKERDMTVELGEKLKTILEGDKKYEVFITRDMEFWNPIFANYFKNNWNSIISWEKSSRQEYNNLITFGFIEKSLLLVPHNSAPPNVALRLFGITKWANENNIDLMVHIHFNDDVIHKKNLAGKYLGFSIYIPTSSYSNSSKSKKIAEKIFKYLSKNNSVSNYEKESLGIIFEPRLIAVGVNNTSNASSLLIEYGYIYEPKFNNNLKSQILAGLASSTYLGLNEYYNQN